MATPTLITDGSVISVPSAAPIGLAIISSMEKKGIIYVINDDSTNYVVFYIGGGDPNNLPAGWTWDKTPADKKIYVNKGENIPFPANAKNMVAQAVGGNVVCRFIVSRRG